MTLDHDKWDKTATEPTHLNFLKHILGVNRSTNNIICRAKLGRYPVSIDINTRIINFYKHVRSMPKDTIIQQTYLLAETLKQKGVTGTLAQYIKNTGHIYNPEIISFPKSSIKKMFENKYEIYWKDRLKITSRGVYYGTFKSNIRYEAYFDQISQRKFRCTLTKLRLSDHNLMIEKGRKKSTKLLFGDRKCKLCFSENFQATEDEVHFLFDCSWRKYEKHRQKLTNDIINLVPHALP